MHILHETHAEKVDNYSKEDAKKMQAARRAAELEAARTSAAATSRPSMRSVSDAFPEPTVLSRQGNLMKWMVFVAHQPS